MIMECRRGAKFHFYPSQTPLMREKRYLDEWNQGKETKSKTFGTDGLNPYTTIFKSFGSL